MDCAAFDCIFDLPVVLYAFFILRTLVSRQSNWQGYDEPRWDRWGQTGHKNRHLCKLISSRAQGRHVGNASMKCHY